MSTIIEDAATETETYATFPLTELQTALAAVAPHMGKDPVTPILQTVQYDAEAHTLTATDRYTVGRFVLAPSSEAGQGGLIPLEVVAWVRAIKLASLRLYNRHTVDPSGGYSVRIEWTDKDVTVFVVWGDGPKAERSQTFNIVTGNYPPVARLLEGFTPAHDAYPVGLTTANLDKLHAFSKFASKDGSFVFEMAEVPTGGKLAPVRATWNGPEDFTVLIQPILKRSA